MSFAAQPRPADVERFLAEHHGAPIAELEPLTGGFWSNAFGYRVGDRRLVLRIGADSAGFEMDRAARSFDRPGLPVPEVLAVGEALGRCYAISVRHTGRFLELVDATEAERAGPAILAMLGALRSVGGNPWPVPWGQAGAPASGAWHTWLHQGLTDDPGRRVSGWRSRLRNDPQLDRLFRACRSEIDQLASACPQRSDLVHGDLLHQNVLVSNDASRVTAVFSWKCSTLGDFLYDVAWCTFWGPWHPGIAAADVWGRISTLTDGADPDLMVDAAVRHRCYLLHIGATHLAWNAWTNNEAELGAMADRLSQVLDAAR
ncbi:MAG: phosphotransferase [Microthrixaceae bacterium]